MLNVVTVHWQSPQWLEIQLRYLDRYLDRPYRIFASLNGIDRMWWDRFHFAADLEGTHPEKLNELAAIVGSQSGPDDLLMFIDGDAFPIAPITSWLDEVLASHALAALRRDENLGDLQPHPAFCVTSVGFWNEIGGDWRAGYEWENEAGTTTDVGGQLLATLRARGLGWRPLLRTNTTNLHPVWFGVYEHRIYHHGAGFRPRVSRVDLLRDPEVYEAVDPLGTDRTATIAGLRRSEHGRTERRRERQLRRDERLATRVFSRIADDDAGIYRRLDRAAG